MNLNSTLVLSDIHLGSDNCNTAKVIEVLKTNSADTIIINGDFFDSRHIHRLNKEQWKVLSQLRKLSNNSRIVLLIGNHDYFESDILSNLLGFEVYDRLTLNISGVKYLFIHGHIFDFIITQHGWFSRFVSECYYQLCRKKWMREQLNKLLHTKSHTLDENCKVKEHAIKYAKSKDVNWIVCGHTHVAEWDTKNGYLNSGTFCSDHPTFITIAHDGSPTLRG